MHNRMHTPFVLPCYIPNSSQPGPLKCIGYRIPPFVDETEAAGCHNTNNKNVDSFGDGNGCRLVLSQRQPFYQYLQADGGSYSEEVCCGKAGMMGCLRKSDGDVPQNLRNTRLNWEKLVNPHCWAISVIRPLVFISAYWAFRMRVIWI